LFQKRSFVVLTLLILTAGLALGAHAGAAKPATHSRSAKTTAQGGGGSVAFDPPTVVDNYRPGFEPDIAYDTSPGGSGATYTSTPYGFSSTQSFIYRSDDQRQSFHLTAGNVLGKPLTCAGGGDTEMKVDPVNGDLYFVDLQGLTNFSTSVSSDHGSSWQTNCAGVDGTGVDRQWLGLDTNGGQDAIGSGPTGGRLYLDYDNTNQNTDTGDNDQNLAGNQLVMNESIDGQHYGADCEAAALPCPLPPAVISRDEGIPGNIVVDNVPGSPFQHRVYAIHTGSLGKSVIVSYCSGKLGDNSAATVAADCTDPTQVSSSDPGHVNVNWHDSFPRAAGPYLTGNLFASIAIDRAGNLYATWSEYPVDSNGDENGPGVVKVAVSTDGAKTWSAPITVSPASLGNNVMPWVTAGDAGRIDIAWYGAPQTSDNGSYGPDTLDNGTWNVYMAQSLNALTAHPSFSVTKVSDHQAKFGNISTQGLGGSPDRSLGDFMQVTTGARGQALISYVDDTSADRNPDFCQGCGQTPAEAAGPIMVATQSGGPSLFASVGSLKPPRQSTGTASDRSGDSFFWNAGTQTEATPSLDLTGATVTQPDASHLKVTLSTADSNLANDLAVQPNLGGPVGEWLVRWAAPTYHNGPGDGNIFYVGMESAGGGAPEFYTGTTGAITTTHVKYFTYPKTTDIPGSIKGNTITWTVPLSDVGKPAAGDGLFAVTGFTATQLTPSLQNLATLPNSGTVGDENIPNVLDSTGAFSFTVK
jgi:hypothetical protein